MPDSPFDRELEELLGYSEAPESDVFVANVMRNVQRQKRLRRVILWSFGLIGALFGLAGAVMLSGPIKQLFSFPASLPATETMQLVLFVVAAAAFYVWFMNDDYSLGG
jgi:ABC-type uncharacterized transport system permease subunit